MTNYFVIFFQHLATAILDFINATTLIAFIRNTDVMERKIVEMVQMKISVVSYCLYYNSMCDKKGQNLL